MKVMVIGKGGREHALVKALQQSPSVEQIFALPGNPGMKGIECVDVPLNQHKEVVIACAAKGIDLIVIGPEDPLAEGLSNVLRTEGFLVFGPDQRGAQLEASKTFAKEFMEKYSIPSAKFQKVKTVKDIENVVDQFTPPYVLKADGLAAGKGVFICKTKEELYSNAGKIFNENLLGDAGKKAIIEQFQPGYELSFFILTNGEGYVCLPLAQDHKKLLDNDEGPNTGGMGTVAPMKISTELYQSIIDEVVEKTVAGFEEEKFLYRGVVFIGLMITEEGPQVLEYNVRFGDPETQVLLPLLKGDWGLAFEKIALGEIPELEWKDQATACVVMAAENYPDAPVKGAEIKGDLLTSHKDSYFLHAGTDFKDSQWQTAGGRVLNAIGVAPTLKEAIAKAYEQTTKAQWSGMQLRKDIGQKALDL